MDVWNCRNEKSVIGVLGSGPSGLPSSSTEGCVCGCVPEAPLPSASLPSVWAGEAIWRGGTGSAWRVGERR